VNPHLSQPCFCGTVRKVHCCHGFLSLSQSLASSCYMPLSPGP
jgi:hypothetical protein